MSDKRININTKQLNQFDKVFWDKVRYLVDMQIEEEDIIDNFDDEVPRLFFEGNLSNFRATKADVRVATFEFRSRKMNINGYCTLGPQGNTSLVYDKKNLTIKLYEDQLRTKKMKVEFKNWDPQSKFVLKANWIDTLHCRNLVCNQIAAEMINTRPSGEITDHLKSLPNHGVVDGFPVRVFFNGEFYGLYSFNIPKEDWMLGMDEDNPNHAFALSEVNGFGQEGVVTSCQFRKNYTLDSGEWEWEIPDVVPQSILDGFNALINCIKDTDDETFMNEIGNHIDLDSVIDYYCFAYAMCHHDGFGKNMMICTLDGGNKWFLNLYDLDTTFGSNNWGTAFFPYNHRCPEDYNEPNNLLFERVINLFPERVVNRYFDLRKHALSAGSIIDKIEKMSDKIQDNYFKEEQTKWVDLPSIAENTHSRMIHYMKNRLSYTDIMLGQLYEVPRGIDISTQRLVIEQGRSQVLTSILKSHSGIAQGIAASTSTYAADGTDPLSPDNITWQIITNENNVISYTANQDKLHINASNIGEASINCYCTSDPIVSTNCDISVIEALPCNIQTTLTTSNFTVAGTINSTTGDITTLKDYYTTDFIQIEDCEIMRIIYSLSGGRNNNLYVSFYNEEYEFKGQEDLYSTGLTLSPAAYATYVHRKLAKYIRFSMNTKKTTVNISVVTNCQQIPSSEYLSSYKLSTDDGSALKNQTGWITTLSYIQIKSPLKQTVMFYNEDNSFNGEDFIICQYDGNLNYLGSVQATNVTSRNFGYSYSLELNQANCAYIRVSCRSNITYPTFISIAEQNTINLQ